jgi:hypothetical protein
LANSKVHKTRIHGCARRIQGIYSLTVGVVVLEILGS